MTPEYRRKVLDIIGDLDRPNYGAAERKTGIGRATLRKMVQRERARRGPGPERKAVTRKVTERVTEECHGAVTVTGRADSGPVSQPVASEDEDDPRVTSVQAKAAEMLLAGYSCRQAAEVLDVSARSIERWRNESGFQGYYRDMETRIREQVVARLIGLREAAMDRARNLVELMDGKEVVSFLRLLTQCVGPAQPQEVAVSGEVGHRHFADLGTRLQRAERIAGSDPRAALMEDVEDLRTITLAMVDVVDAEEVEQGDTPGEE